MLLCLGGEAGGGVGEIEEGLELEHYMAELEN